MIRRQWTVQCEEVPSTVEEVIALLLRNRGLTPESFLGLELPDLERYLRIRGLDEAARIMARHLSNGHHLVLAGDYDCDGVTATAQMSLFLKDIGYDHFAVVIPTRENGYGVPLRAVTGHPGARLLVAMDCGSLDVETVAAARARGMDVIVLDHHEVTADGTAPATVLVNPKHAGCPSAFKEFCASGLVLLFLTRLRKALEDRWPRPVLNGRYLALSAVGTIADMVPLIEGNRIIAAEGLRAINRGVSLPIEQIRGVSGLVGRKLTAGHVGFYLAPRLNAAGRVADPLTAYRLLVENDRGRAAGLSRDLNLLNLRRQQEEVRILEEVRRRLNGRPPETRTLVVGDSRWPPGLVGIVASRIQQELHYGPVVVLSIDSREGTARGSVRSVSGFDVHEALGLCGDLLARWGGHKMAAGLTVAVDRIEAFADRFEAVAQSADPEVFVPRGRIDLPLDPELVTTELYEAIQELEPHGVGNPAPVFVSKGVDVQVQRIFGKNGEHLNLLVGDSVPAVWWNGAASLPAGRTIRGDVVFQVDWDAFRQRVALDVKAVLQSPGP
ncbi:single-stranded-DNA-specific exonuclease RecJ [Desulfoglaeba alkanexedens]|uniref:Single-stranded-DNA-specific exonuclease RecJ n=1 Tax=Desulfoglaeba alkanexedens ALDC TaxID=980445 RepID=A0A4P8L1U8_9BACT|nr:DHH family phosphoesterase [Desulfoglaeba alkanexedens]QCQ21674.1 hypothetical protein FDQ92_05460 [Desulfoglaeba alkanexedens ALDC]